MQSHVTLEIKDLTQRSYGNRDFNKLYRVIARGSYIPAESKCSITVQSASIASCHCGPYSSAYLRIHSAHYK